MNGVSGMLFTAKTNGNSIFLPAAGYYDAPEGIKDAGITGYYSSSTLYTYNPSTAWCFTVSSQSPEIGLPNRSREDGHSVRAVRTSGQN